MYIVIKSDKAEHMETKLHQLGACISDMIDMFRSARHISHMPEDYVDHARGGGRMRATHEDHPIHDGYPHDGYYAPTERYPYPEHARGRGRY